MPLYGQKKFDVINRPHPRMEGIEKVTGKARYAADIYMEDMLYAGMLRSPYTSARVVSINTEKAKAIEGVEAVVIAADMPNNGATHCSYMYLTDVVRYAGDCVAMVAAKTKALVEEALAAIEVEYEELPGVYTIEEALAEGAPQLHEKYPGNIFTESVYNIRKGDVSKGFEEADLILERDYTTQYIEHSYIEPEAVVAHYNPNDGVMTVNSSSQHAFFTRRYISRVLETPMNKCRVVMETLGGSFGGKEEGVGIAAGRAAFLAKLTGKPVKLVFTREDSFLESSKRHPFKIHYKIGVKKDGTIVAWEGQQIDNSGAYNNQTLYMNWRAAVHSTGPYEIPNVSTDTYGVFTNNIHSGAMRGYSSPQLIFAQEQFIDEVAEALGMDEVEFRRKNCLKEGSLTATGAPVEHVILQEVMDYTVEQTDYQRKHAEYKKQTSTKKRKGIGMSIAYRSCGFGAEQPDAGGCFIKVNEDGSVSVNIGLTEMGQGLKTTYALIAAEALGVPYETVFCYGCDTHAIIDSGMTAASRGTVMGAQSVRKAGETLHKVLIQDALELKLLPLDKVEEEYGLEKGSLSFDNIAIDDVDLRNGVFFLKKYPNVTLPLSVVSTVGTFTGKNLGAYEWYEPEPFNQNHATGQGKAGPTFGYGCCVAEVEVDMTTGFVDVKKVTSSHDVGTVINPPMAKGQIYGGIVMGCGYGISEEVNVSKGRVKDTNFDSYIIPTSMDAPEMQINLFECDDPAGTYGAKSLGEPSTEAVGAAIANAVYNATGRRIYNNPATLENVLLGKKLS